jgi:hypothetical protein
VVPERPDGGRPRRTSYDLILKGEWQLQDWLRGVDLSPILRLEAAESRRRRLFYGWSSVVQD